MKDLTTISTDLFNKVRSRFSNVKLGDQAGVVITDPSNARFFDLDFTHEGASLGHVNIKIDDKSLTVIYNDSMVEGQNVDAKNDWYNFLKELRMFAKSNMLNFDTRDITKTNLDKRDYEYLAQENGDMKMSESKLWGTSKTSFQDMGEAKIIVKHSQPVNYAVPAGRTMHIDSIYIENAAGERFRYPHRHLNGARAMATHVANGGTVYDAIGAHISGLSEELSKLRQFKNYTQRNGLQEALSDVSELVLTRISNIKEQIAKLQRQNYYAEFAEGFKPSRELPIPEETVNTWIDALTIKTFNEELKSVFPFIYRLVDQPESIGYEDLVGEGKKCNTTEEGKMCPVHGMKECGMYEDEDKYCDACDRPANECVCDDKDLEEHNHLEDFERHLDDISTFEYDIPQQQQQPQQAANAREVVEFIMSMYDQEQGTFPKGEEGVKIAVEKRFGDHAGQFAEQVVERLSAKEQAHQPDFESMQGAIREAADAATVGELEAAIKKFQQAAGIAADGKMGPATQKAMQAAKTQQPGKGATAPASTQGGAPAAAPAAAPAPAAAAAPADEYAPKKTGAYAAAQQQYDNPAAAPAPNMGQVNKGGYDPAAQQAPAPAAAPAPSNQGTAAGFAPAQGGQPAPAPGTQPAPAQGQNPATAKSKAALAQWQKQNPGKTPPQAANQGVSGTDW